jgi:hypothetical protein
VEGCGLALLFILRSSRRRTLGHHSRKSSWVD